MVKKLRCKYSLFLFILNTFNSYLFFVCLYLAKILTMKKIIFWLFILALTYVLILWTKAHPAWIDHFYLPYIYARFNQILSFSFDRFSFSVGDILYALVILLFIRKIIVIIKSKRKIVVRLTTLVVQFVALFYLWFNISWGLCNYQTPLHEKLNISTKYTLTDLQNETQRLIHVVNHLQQQVASDGQAVEIEADLAKFSLAAQEGYRNIKDEIRFPVHSISDVKASLYSKVITKMGFSGYFNPFTHENQVNIEVPAVSLCVTSAHEIAHQLGYANESEANFLGYLSLLHQDNKTYQYAANLYALKYCLKEIFRNDSAHAEFYLEQINAGSKKDIQIVNDFWQSHRNISTDWSHQFYGRFLKLNNQKEGIRSYHLFVNLLIGYHQDRKITVNLR